MEIHHGSATGLDLSRSEFSTGSPGIPGVGDSFEGHFGDALTAGDFDADGFDDLAIGHPGYSPDFDFDSGRIVVLYGSAPGSRPRGRATSLRTTPAWMGRTRTTTTSEPARLRRLQRRRLRRPRGRRAGGERRRGRAGRLGQPPASPRRETALDPGRCRRARHRRARRQARLLPRRRRLRRRRLRRHRRRRAELRPDHRRRLATDAGAVHGSSSARRTGSPAPALDVDGERTPARARAATTWATRSRPATSTRDGYADLAVGAEGKRSATVDAGEVTILPGTPRRELLGRQRWHQDVAGRPRSQRGRDRSGRRSPPATSTATASPTSPSAGPPSRPARTAPTGRSGSSTATSSPTAWSPGTPRGGSRPRARAARRQRHLRHHRCELGTSSEPVRAPRHPVRSGPTIATGPGHGRARKGFLPTRTRLRPARSSSTRKA